jgi:hypothetical protein
MIYQKLSDYNLDPRTEKQRRLGEELGPTSRGDGGNGGGLSQGQQQNYDLRDPSGVSEKGGRDRIKEIRSPPQLHRTPTQLVGQAWGCPVAPGCACV